MRRSELGVVLGLLAAVSLFGNASAARAQAPGVNQRPQAGPFDPAQMLSEAPPAAGVAIKAAACLTLPPGRC